MKSPIIFIGMHRSGTSMLGRLLEDLGLFSGVRKDENNEAIFFHKLNQWMMAQCGGRWDMPDALQCFWDNEERLTWVEDYLQQLLESPRFIEFVGIQRFFVSGGIKGLNVPWSWKDPQNTYTLPMWRRIFPNAKVVYIERHGVDVAESLRVRSRKSFNYSTKKYNKYRSITPYLPKKHGFVDSPRCATLEGAFSLWEDYVNQADKVILECPQDMVLKLRYEDFLENPVLNLTRCVDFCELNVSTEKIKALTVGVNDSRAYSYLKDPELIDFAHHKKNALVVRGYR